MSNGRKLKVPPKHENPERAVENVVFKANEYLADVELSAVILASKQPILDKLEEHLKALTLVREQLKRDGQWDGLSMKNKNALEAAMAALQGRYRDISGRASMRAVPHVIRSHTVEVDHRQITSTPSTGDWEVPEYVRVQPTPTIRNLIGGENAQRLIDNIPVVMNEGMSGQDWIDDYVSGSGVTLTPRQQMNGLFGEGLGTQKDLDIVYGHIRNGRFDLAAEYASDPKRNLNRGGLLAMAEEKLLQTTRTETIPGLIYNMRIGGELIISPDTPDLYQRKHGIHGFKIGGGANIIAVTGDREVTGWERDEEGNLVKTTERGEPYAETNRYYDFGTGVSVNLFHKTLKPTFYATITEDGDISIKHVRLTVGDPRNPLFTRVQEVTVSFERPLVIKAPEGLKPGTYQFVANTKILIPTSRRSSIIVIPSVRATTERELGGDAAAFFRYDDGWKLQLGARAGKIPGSDAESGTYLGPEVNLMDVASVGANFFTDKGNPVVVSFNIDPFSLAQLIKDLVAGRKLRRRKR